MSACQRAVINQMGNTIPARGWIAAYRHAMAEFRRRESIGGGKPNLLAKVIATIEEHKFERRGMS